MDKQLKFWTDDTPAVNASSSNPEPCEYVEGDAAMPPEEPTRLITLGVIAQVTGQPIHRVRWILDTRTDIRPAAYAGNFRLFTQSAIARVRHELNAIDARRSARK